MDFSAEAQLQQWQNAHHHTSQALEVRSEVHTSQVSTLATELYNMRLQFTQCEEKPPKSDMHAQRHLAAEATLAEGIRQELATAQSNNAHLMTEGRVVEADAHRLRGELHQVRTAHSDALALFQTEQGAATGSQPGCGAECSVAEENCSLARRFTIPASRATKIVRAQKGAALASFVARLRCRDSFVAPEPLFRSIARSQISDAL